MSIPNGKRCEECGALLTGRRRVVCDRRVKPECFAVRMNRRFRMYWKIKRDREKLAKSRGPYRIRRYNVYDFQRARTPEKAIKIFDTIINTIIEEVR